MLRAPGDKNIPLSYGIAPRCFTTFKAGPSSMEPVGRGIALEDEQYIAPLFNSNCASNVACGLRHFR
jgi:hypothetical protein